MSIELMTKAWRLALPASQKLVLLALCHHANKEGGECFPSTKTLIRECGLCLRTVQRSLLELQAAGQITIERRIGRCNYFSVHPGNVVTPATLSPRQLLPPPRQPLPGTPATVAPINIREPSPNRSSRRVPLSWVLTPELRSALKRECPQVDQDLEERKFRDHTFGVARSDWNATFRNWVRKAAEARAPPVQSKFDVLYNRIGKKET